MVGTKRFHLKRGKSSGKCLNRVVIDKKRSAIANNVEPNFNIIRSNVSNELENLSNGKFINTNFKQDFFQELNTLLNDKLFTDITLISADLQRYEVHSIVLISNSKLFKEHSLQQRASEWCVPARGDILEKVIKYCYTGEIMLMEDNVRSICHLACLWQLDDLAKACGQLLINYLNLDNCIETIKLTKNIVISLYNEIAVRYFEEHFMTISQQNDFKTFTSVELETLLKCDDLNVNSEEDVFEVFLHWLEKFPEFDVNLPITAEHLVEQDRRIPFLLDVIRFPLISPEYFAKTVEKVCAYFKRTDLIIEFYKWITLTTAESPMRNRIANKRMIPRTKTSLRLVACYWEAQNEFCIEVLDKRGERWLQLPVILTEKQHESVIVLYDEMKIIALGGINAPVTLNEVTSLDLAKMKIESLQPMKHARYHHAAEILNKDIYVAGGRNTKNWLNFVEKWNHTTQRWEELTPLLKPRCLHNLIAVNGLLYAIGGRSRTTAFNCVECYNPETNTWNFRMAMNRRRIAAGVAALDHFLYVIGGCEQISSEIEECAETETVERYDIETNAWTLIASISSPRDRISAAFLNNTLYSVGGYDEHEQCTKKVEKYDKKTNKWYPVSSLNSDNPLGVFTMAKSIEDWLHV